MSNNDSAGSVEKEALSRRAARSGEQGRSLQPLAGGAAQMAAVTSLLTTTELIVWRAQFNGALWLRLAGIAAINSAVPLLGEALTPEHGAGGSVDSFRRRAESDSCAKTQPLKALS